MASKAGRFRFAGGGILSLQQKDQTLIDAITVGRTLSVILFACSVVPSFNEIY